MHVKSLDQIRRTWILQCRTSEHDKDLQCRSSVQDTDMQDKHLAEHFFVAGTLPFVEWRNYVDCLVCSSGPWGQLVGVK